jgi:hypothetical protein
MRQSRDGARAGWRDRMRNGAEAGVAGVIFRYSSEHDWLRCQRYARSAAMASCPRYVENDQTPIW